MKRGTAIAAASITGIGMLGGIWALTRKANGKAAAKSKAKTEPVIVPVPPDAVWLKPDVPASTYETGGYMLTSSTGQAQQLDAGKFLDERFGTLPEEQHPKESQMARIYRAFTDLGVNPSTGIVSVRPSPDAVDAALNLAAAFDVEKAPLVVSTAVRDFAKAAWRLPASQVTA